MAKTVLQEKCVFCGKLVREVSRYTEEGFIYITNECGHTSIKEAKAASQKMDIVSKDGRRPFQYQYDTTDFIEEADCNGLILHEQGLGKTIIACMLLLRNQKSLLPALVVCPSGLRLQWMAEIVRWTGIVPQVITSSNDKPMFEVFPIILVSIDTLRLLRPDVGGAEDGFEWDEVQAEMVSTKIKREPLWDDKLCAKFKFIVVDESQKIKNSGSARTQALRKIAAAANDGKKARVVCMSGTNIEKHAGEFFVTLNLVRPELFPQESVYKLTHCEVGDGGKIGGLRRPLQFKELTKDFIIRYKREEVLPDLPRVFRQFLLAEMEDDDLLKEYKSVVQEFQDYMDDIKKAKNTTDILGYLSRMRHITGVAKVNAASTFVQDFLLSTERKLVVFLHHKKAGVHLFRKLSEVCKDGALAPPLYLSAELSLEARSKIVEEFKKPENRIMLASTQAAGTGLNLQFASDCLIMERQWNPSTEEQAEGRFPRPDSTADKVNATYLIAAGTIDDFLTQIVEEKRRNVAQTLDFQDIKWDEQTLMKQLADVIQRKGLARWKLGGKR